MSRGGSGLWHWNLSGESEAIPLREGELGGATCSPDKLLGSLPAKIPAVHCGWALVLASTSPGCGGGWRQQWQRVRLVTKELDSRLSPGPLVLSRGGGGGWGEAVFRAQSPLCKETGCLWTDG